MISKIMFTSNLGNWERIIDFGNGSNNNNILFSRYSVANQLAFNFGSNISATTTFLSPNIIAQNQACICVARYDPFTSNGTSTIWYNGSNIATSNQMAVSLGADRTVTNIYVGQSEWGGRCIFKCKYL